MTRQMLQALHAGPRAEHERCTDFFVHVLYRPISFALTPAFMRLGASASGVTLINLGLASLMPPIALLVPGQAHLLLALITFACIVLDCVDGNIARATGSGTALGQYLDSLVGKAYHLLLVVALGIVAAHEVPEIGPGWWLAGALAAAVLKIWGRESRAYVKLSFESAEATFAPGRLGWPQILFGAVKLLPFALLAFGALGMVWLLLAGLGLMNLAVFLHTQRRILRRLSRPAMPPGPVATGP